MLFYRNIVLGKSRLPRDATSWLSRQRTELGSTEQIQLIAFGSLLLLSGDFVFDPGPGDRRVLLVDLAADELEAFAHCGLPGAAAAHERIERNAAGRCHQAQQVGHQVSGLHRGMTVAVASTPLCRLAVAHGCVFGDCGGVRAEQPLVSIFAAGLGAVEEAGSAPTVGVESAGHPLAHPAVLDRATKAVGRRFVACHRCRCARLSGEQRDYLGAAVVD